MSVFLVFMFVFLVEFSGCLGGHFDGRKLIPPESGLSFLHAILRAPQL